MATRAKVSRKTARRRTVAVAPRRPAPKAPVVSRPTHPARPHPSHRPAGERDRSIKLTPFAPKVAPSAGGITSYAKALRFLNGLSDYERLRIVRYNAQTFDLERMRNLLKRLGNPQTTFRSVHVAGSKGKGSTCAMIASMLQGCGYKVGLYTSPHLIDIRERIQINGQMIGYAEFTKLVKMIAPMVARSKPVPTYFDVLTGIALRYFADQKVDIAVIETGLGGRLDSTNVIKPEVTAITSISKDHMAQLGDTVDKIAAEKAGIFKNGVPALTVAQPPEVERVLRAAAEKVGAPFDVTGKTIEFSYRFESSRMQGPHNRVCLTTPLSKFEHLAVPLLGDHQALNCGLALAVIDRLKARGMTINDMRAMEGLKNTQLPGRMEMVSTNPRVLVDGAHNAASLDAMMRAIGQHIPYDSMVVIFGCCGDKDIPGMLERITSGADKVIFTRVNNIRTADPDELVQRYVEQYGKMAQVAASLEDALEIAYRAVSKEDLICITGSFYLVGQAKKLIASRAAAVQAALAPPAQTPGV